MKDTFVGNERNDEMGSLGNLTNVLAAVLLLAAPAMFISIASSYYEAPHLKPLAPSREAPTTVEEMLDGGGIGRIDVQVGWGVDWDGQMSQAQLSEIINTTLNHQTKLFRLEYDSVPGDLIEVTFVVGKNSYGPFLPSQMAAGIKSALIALRMTNEPVN